MKNKLFNYLNLKKYATQESAIYKRLKKMKLNWIVVSAICAAISYIVTYLLSENWKISLISAILTFVIIILHNPKTRYMKAFYVVLFPLLSSFFFKLNLKSDNLNLEAGIKELGTNQTLILGIIAILCLLLDWLERNDKLEGTFFSTRKNKIGNINGDNNQINQTNA